MSRKPVQQFPYIRILIFACCGILLIGPLTGLLKMAVPAVRDTALLLREGDYQTIGSRYPSFRQGLSLKRLIPEGSKVEYRAPWNVRAVSIAYYLYPSIIHSPGDYVIDPDHTFDPQHHGALLVEDFLVMDQSDRGFTDNPLPELKAVGQPAFVFCLLQVLIVLIGGLLLRRWGIGDRDGGAIWWLSTAYLSGFAAVTLTLWAVLLICNHLSPWLIAAVFLFWIGALGYANRSVRISDRPAAEGKSDIAALLGHAAVIILATIIFLRTVTTPVFYWDEMTHWVMEAKQFFDFGGLHFASNIWSTYYPVLWPLHIAMLFEVAGSMFDPLAKWATALIFLVFLGQLYGVLYFLNIRKFAGLVVAGFIVLFFHKIFLTALAENIFLAYWTAVFASLLAWLNTRRSAFMLIALVMACALTGTKIEGAVMIVGLIGVVLILGRKFHFQRTDYLRVAALGGSVLIPCIWIVWIKVHGFYKQVYHIGQSWTAANLGESVFIIKQHAVTKTGAVLLLLWAVSLTAKRGIPEERLLVGMIVFVIGFVIAAPIGWPPDHVPQYYPEVAHRMLMRAAPFVMALIALRLIPQSK